MHTVSDATITLDLGRVVRVSADGFLTPGNAQIVPKHAIDPSSPVRDADENSGPGDLVLDDAWWNDHVSRHGS
jgi:hypothetical protein